MITTLLIINGALALLVINRCMKVTELDRIAKTLATMLHYNFRDTKSPEGKIQKLSELYDSAKQWRESGL